MVHWFSHASKFATLSFSYDVIFYCIIDSDFLYCIIGQFHFVIALPFDSFMM